MRRQFIGLQTAFLAQPAHQGVGVTVCHSHRCRAAGFDRLKDTRPIDMVRENKAAVQRFTATVAPHRHPAGGEAEGIRRESADPGRILGRTGCDDNPPPHQPGFGLRIGRNRLGQRSARRPVVGIQSFHRAVHADGPDRGIEAAKHPLRFAQGIGEQDAGPPFRLIVPPPLVDLAKDFGGLGPVVNRQPEGRFRDQGIAADRLEGFTGNVGRGLIVAGDDPDFTTMLDPYLRRPE